MPGGTPGGNIVADNSLDDPGQIVHFAVGDAQSKPLAPMRLKPVTDSAFKSAARAKEASKAPLKVPKVESNDEVLNVTS